MSDGLRPAMVVAWRLALVAGVLSLAAPGDVSRAEEPPPQAPAAPPSAKDPAQVVFAREVGLAIDRGVAWLAAKAVEVRGEGGPFATWGPAGWSRSYGGGPAWTCHPSGPTALALYTLLKCDVDPEHELIRRGFAWMWERHAYDPVYDLDTCAPAGAGGTREYRLPHRNYDLAATILALTALADAHKPSAKSRAAAKAGTLRALSPRERGWLESAVRELLQRQRAGGWGYKRVEGQPIEEDLSVTQLCALALASAQRLGATVDPDALLETVRFTLRAQQADGPAHPRRSAGTGRPGESLPLDRARGFCYMPGSPAGTEGRATGSMTACGLANLLLAREVALQDARTARRWEREHADRCEAATWDAVAWLDLNWSVDANPGTAGGTDVYYLYCVERGMDLLGKHLLGTHAWYEEGARHLLSIQKPQRVPSRLGAPGTVEGTHWNTGKTVNPQDVLDTCFALLYLRRATIRHRAPVATGD